MGKLFFALTVHTIAFIELGVVSSENCAPRKYDFDSVVCVCNASSCDSYLPFQPPGNRSEYILVTSDKNGARFVKSRGTFRKYENVNEADGISVEIHDSKFQKFHGFGGAFTDSAGINILSLNPTVAELLLRSYYASDGLEYNLGRVPIGGTDFSTRGYAYAETEDESLGSFELAMEDFKYKIPLIKRAREIRGSPLKLVAATWTPPLWMKTNSFYYGLGFLKQVYYETYANYHIKFLDKYSENGLDFWAISTGNEPINGIFFFVKINSLGWTPRLHASWIGRHFGPALKASRHNKTKILAIDDQRLLLPWWLNTVMRNEEAAKFIDGVAVHWYWDAIISANVLNRTRNEFPNLFLINTEACNGDKPWDLKKVQLGSWFRAETYVFHMIEDMNNGIGGWIDWNLALNEEGGPNWVSNFVDAAVIVNATKGEFYKQPLYYGLGHFSKFIPVDSTRLWSEVKGGKDVSALAVERSDGAFTVVILNRNSDAVKLNVIHGNRTTTLNITGKSFNSMLYKI